MAEATPAFASFEQKWLATYPEQNTVAIFLSPHERLRASAFGCLVYELEQAAFGLREPQVAAVKLGWWRQELIDAAGGKPRHPVSAVLFADPQVRAVPAASWTALTDGAMAMLDESNASSLDDLFAHYATWYTPLARIESALFGGESRQQNAVATLCTISHLLRSLPMLASADERLRLPLDLLARYGLTRSMLNQASEPRAAALRDYLRLLAERIEAALCAASRATLARRVRARLDLGLIRSATKAADPLMALTLHSQAGRWQSLWLAWNEARKRARMR